MQAHFFREGIPYRSTETALRSSKKCSTVERFPSGLTNEATRHFRFQLAATRLSARLGFVDEQIHIEQLEVLAHVGVPDDERLAAQRLTFCITLWPLREMKNMNDDISQTVNYASVCAETRKFVAASRNKLIETLADALARHLLATFEIRRIAIELRKYILPDVEFVSVRVTQERPEK
jgi:FolB domain-containing protein